MKFVDQESAQTRRLQCFRPSICHFQECAISDGRWQYAYEPRLWLVVSKSLLSRRDRVPFCVLNINTLKGITAALMSTLKTLKITATSYHAYNGPEQRHSKEVNIQKRITQSNNTQIQLYNIFIKLQPTKSFQTKNISRLVNELTEVDKDGFLSWHHSVLRVLYTIRGK